MVMTMTLNPGQSNRVPAEGRYVYVDSATGPVRVTVILRGPENRELRSVVSLTARQQVRYDFDIAFIEVTNDTTAQNAVNITVGWAQFIYNNDGQLVVASAPSTAPLYVATPTGTPLHVALDSSTDTNPIPVSAPSTAPLNVTAPNALPVSAPSTAPLNVTAPNALPVSAPSTAPLYVATPAGATLGVTTPGNIDTAALINASAVTTTQTGADQTNANGRGVKVALNMTNVGTGSVTLQIQGKDVASGQYYNILQSAAITANGLTVLEVYPGIANAANSTQGVTLPKTWRVVALANNANATTYTVGASVMV